MAMTVAISLVFLLCTPVVQSIRRDRSAMNLDKQEASSTLSTRELHDEWKGYVINLKKSTDRLEKLSSAWSAKPWFKKKFCRFDAIDGSDVVKMRSWVKKGEAPGNLGEISAESRGIWSCGKSHVEVWKKIAQDKHHKYGVVAEDDVYMFSPQFDELFYKWRQSAKYNKAGFVYFESIGNLWRNHQNPKVNLTETEPELHSIFHKSASLDKHFSQFDDGSKNQGDGIWHYHVYGLGLYAISREAAAKAVEIMGIHLSGVDGQFSRKVSPKIKEMGLDMLAFIPPIAQQGSEGSLLAHAGKHAPPKHSDHFLHESALHTVGFPDC
eukprot:jgi/Bigna1/90759/estExt_fgenesh1_pg.C_780080